MADTVFVSGGSGYIAGYLIRQLVQQGWTVHTSVRDLAREAQLRELLAVDNVRLTVFAADLTRDAGWAEAMQGCSHVAHVASPLPGNWVKKPDDLIVPDEAVPPARRIAKCGSVWPAPLRGRRPWWRRR